MSAGRTDAPRAVVIGSGVAGSAAALLLAHAGIPTTLVEKNRRVGGSCSSYEKQGFKIDIGTHMFCRGPRGPLGDVLRRVGEEGAIDFRRTRDIAELRFARRDQGREVLHKIAVPASLSRIPRFAWELARAMKLTPREAADAARFFTHVLTMSDEEVLTWDHRPLDELIARYTRHAPTIGVFGLLLGLYFILPYWEVSAGEALHCFRQMAYDNHLSYPIGGSIAVPGTYVRLAEQNGAQVRTGAGVRRVVVLHGRVAGVELEDGTTLPANLVISTSSVRTTVLRLVGAEHFPEAYVDAARKLRGSYIAVQAKVGLKKKLVDAGAIVGAVGEDVDLLGVREHELVATFRAVEAGRVPEILPLYCPVPTNFDPSLAPPGCQLLTACAVAPTSDVTLEDPGHRWEEAMLSALRRIVPGLDENAIFVDCFGVDFIERWIGKEFGPAVSTGQTPDQVGRKRPSVYTPLYGLYIAGCGAGARGVGTELAAASAMECVDRVLADLGRDVPATPTQGSLRRTALRAATRPLAWATRSS
jgi:prolycopene isomerase